MKLTLTDILTDWSADDIRNVLHVEPSTPCELIADHGTFRLYATENGTLAVGSGVGESGASFDEREIQMLLSATDTDGDED